MHFTPTYPSWLNNVESWFAKIERDVIARRHEPRALGEAQRARAYAYLKDVLERLPAQPASRVEELLPHRWQPTIIAT